MLTELPLQLSGHVYRSPMPFGRYDPDHETWKNYEACDIQLVVVLASDEECESFTGINLREMYSGSGLEVIYLPIPDFSVPDLEELRAAVRMAYIAASTGQNVAIHCNAGIGRTGLFAACLARQVLGLNGDDAIQWVRKWIPEALETDEQQSLVRVF